MDEQQVQNNLSRGWRIAIALLAAAVSLSCMLVTQAIPRALSGGAAPGLIAYLGADGNIYTVDRAGQRTVAITGDANLDPRDNETGRVYQYPTWAPDGRRLAFVGLSASTLTDTQATLYTASPDGKERLSAFTSQNYFPFYLYWAPDSTRVAFLSSDPGGLGMALIVAAADGSDSQLVGFGQPYYWDWSPDSQVIVTHTGGTAAIDPRARMVFHPMDGSGEHTELDLRPGSFLAPDWSPDGDQLALGVLNEAGVSELVLTGPDGASKRVLAQIGGQVAFAWSPDGQRLAYTSAGMGSTQGIFSSLVVIDPARPEAAQPIVEDTLLGFFWSPDSRKIAYFTPDLDGPEGTSPTSSRLGLHLNVHDLASGENRRLASFEPALGLLQVLPYFDQYHRSGTLWSPDSTHLVLAVVDPDGVSRIVTVQVADGELQPIAEGEAAFWSWR